MALFGSRSDEGHGAGETTGVGSSSLAGSSAPAASAAPRPALSAFIDQGSEFEGKLSFKDTVRIDGCFRGEIASENTLVVGETGEIFASVRSCTVVIAGSVTGDISASDRLVLEKTARVDGDVTAGSLQIEDGASLNGRITMKRRDAKS